MSLSIHLHYADGCITSVNTSLKRPRDALGNWLLQQPVNEALTALPMLFSVCGRSHELAARLALRHPGGEDNIRRLTNTAMLESLREYLIRLLQHWNYPVSRPALGQWMQALHSDSTPQADLASAWLQLLPGYAETAEWQSTLLQQWQTRFAAIHLSVPAGREKPTRAEWSPQANQESPQFYAGNGAATLLSAPAQLPTLLLQVLDDMQRDMRYLAGRLCGDTTGYALIQHCRRDDQHGQHSEGWVRTSRGWLCHRVSETSAGQQWQVIAPTDINFSTGSLPGELLTSLTLTPEQLVPAVTAIIQAIDPCVEFRISVNGENHA